jgi:predicted metal-dependent hydrolase
MAEARSYNARPFRHSFAEVPRHWFAQNAVSTHLVNAINLFFPEGEMFFVRAVRHFEKEIDDPALRAEIRAFYAQEGRHAHAHERYFDALRAHGYEIDGLVRAVTWLLRGGARATHSPTLALSITAALEHYTAVMAELMYVDPYFKQLDPTMRELLLWHAAEEIEHKAVAFDVLAKVRPGYANRMAGFLVATPFLAAMWLAGTVSLVRQDKLPLSRVLRDVSEVLRHEIMGRKIFLRALVTYVDPSFHPLTNDNYAMVRDYLERFEAELERKAA